MTTILILVLVAFISYLCGTITESLHFNTIKRLDRRFDVPMTELQRLLTQGYLQRALFGLKLVFGYKPETTRPVVIHKFDSHEPEPLPQTNHKPFTYNQQPDSTPPQ